MQASFDSEVLRWPSYLSIGVSHLFGCWKQVFDLCHCDSVRGVNSMLSHQFCSLQSTPYQNMPVHPDEASSNVDGGPDIHEYSGSAAAVAATLDLTFYSPP